MSDHYEVRRIDDTEEWDAFVRGAVHSTVFSTSAWLRAAQQAMGGEVLLYGCYKNHNLIGGCSGLSVRRGILSKVTTPLITPHGGMLYAPIPAKRRAKLEAEYAEATARMADRLASEFSYIQLSHAPTLMDIRTFIWRDWAVRTRYTYVMELTDLARLWDQFETRTWTVIRKAERAGFRVRREEDLDLFKTQYRMMVQARGITSALSLEATTAFYKAVQDAGLSETFLAESAEGIPACMVVFVRGFDTLYAWISGADPQFDQSGALSLLYWRVFQEMASEFPRFDFVGANLPSIAKFKRGFGGELVGYFVTEKYASPWIKYLAKARIGLKRNRE